jgi:hypothetical protein
MSVCLALSSWAFGSNVSKSANVERAQVPYLYLFIILFILFVVVPAVGGARTFASALSKATAAKRTPGQCGHLRCNRSSRLLHVVRWWERTRRYASPTCRCIPWVWEVGVFIALRRLIALALSRSRELPSFSFPHPRFNRRSHCVCKTEGLSLRAYNIWCFIP